MLRLFVVNLLCFAAYQCYESTEQPLVRCPRLPICDPCKFGRRDININGCPTCECLPSPCETRKCEEGEVCVAKGCIQGLSDCSTAMCIKQEPEFSRCLMSPMCGNYCKKYAKNEDGCDTCNCEESNDDKNPTGDETTEIYGDKPIQEAEVTSKLPLDCPLVDCFEPCEFGYAKDSVSKCPTCNCLCEDKKMCEPGMQCSSRQPCEDCDVEPVCQVRSLCQNRRSRDPSIQCTASGEFKSKRCVEGICWCINEAGDIVQGSKQIDDNRTECEYMRSMKAMLDFKLVHQIKDVEIHIPQLNLIVHEHISQWMSIERDLVHVSIIKDNEEMTSRNMLLVKVTVLSTERSIDLPSAVFNLRHLMNHHHCHVHYNPAPGLPESRDDQGHNHQHDLEGNTIRHTLRVEDGDHSLHVKHHYKSYDNADNIRHFFDRHSMHHRPHFIMSSLMFFATVMMLGSLWALCMLCKKRAAMKKSLPLWRKTLLSDFSANPYAKFNDNDEIIVSPGNGKEKMPIQGPVVQVAPPMTDSMIIA